MSLETGVKGGHGLGFAFDEQQGKSGVAFITLDEYGIVLNCVAMASENGQVTCRYLILQTGKLDGIFQRSLFGLLGFLEATQTIVYAY